MNNNPYENKFPDQSALRTLQDTILIRRGTTLAVKLEARLAIHLHHESGLVSNALQIYGDLVIEYLPRHECLDSDSLREYLEGFKEAMYSPYEAVSRITRDLIELLDPTQMELHCKFKHRGIEVEPGTLYVRPELGDDDNEEDEAPEEILPPTILNRL